MGHGRQSQVEEKRLGGDQHLSWEQQWDGKVELGLEFQE